MPKHHLSPCPFCGGGTATIMRPSEDDAHIGCVSCGARGGIFAGKSDAETRKAAGEWNRLSRIATMPVLFGLTPEENDRVANWYAGLKERILAKGPKDPLESGEPYYGAIGGGLTYEFSPNGLGLVTKVHEALTKETLDITDYESW